MCIILYPGYPKAVLDRVGTAFAKHYGLTQAELDCIINYDIKYRMMGAHNE